MLGWMHPIHRQFFGNNISNTDRSSIEINDCAKKGGVYMVLVK